MRFLYQALCLTALAMTPLSAPFAEDAASSGEGYWNEQLLAEPRPEEMVGPGKPVPLPEKQKQQVIEEIRNWAKDRKQAGELNPPFNEIASIFLQGSLASHEKDASYYVRRDWIFIQPLEPGERVYRELPVWYQREIEEAVRRLSLPARRVVRDGPVQAWSVKDGAWAWAGPSVKEGSASYRQDNAGMFVRLAMEEKQGTEIYRWAQAFGHRIDLRLVAGDQPRYPHSSLILEGKTDIPVWIVSPEGLLPARLSAFRSGGTACEGSQWMELQYAGEAMPAVWAVLIFADQNLAKSAVVRRVKNNEELGYRETRRSELTLTWPQGKLPALRILARRFDWMEADQTGLPDPKRSLGHAWGSQVLTSMSPAEMREQGYAPAADGRLVERMLSAAGTPACPPP